MVNIEKQIYSLYSPISDSVTIWEKIFSWESSYFMGYKHIGISFIHNHLDTMFEDVEKSLESKYEK